MSAPRRLPALLVAAVVVVVALGLAHQLALSQLRGAVERSLGPRATVADVRIGLGAVELIGLRVRADREGRDAWPVDDELRAARVRIVPDLSSLWTEGWRVHRITVEQGYLSIQRARDGRLRLLPGVLQERAVRTATTPAPSPALRIGEVVLDHTTIDFHDASVRQPAHRMQFEQVKAEAGPLLLPALDRPVDVTLQGVFKGPQRNGRVSIKGQLTPSSRDARIEARFTGVDLLALQPYLVKMGETVQRGTLDLTLDASVRQQQLNAPGTLVLSDLELGSRSFAGLPRQAVLAGMSRDGKLKVDFVLQGRLDDPKFSLNEAMATKVALGLAQLLGVSVGGLVEGVGAVVKGLLGR